MLKLDITKVNRSNNDIWALLKVAIKTKNIALIETNLHRLHALQEYYIKTLNLQDIELRQMEAILKMKETETEKIEKEWITELAKKGNIYGRLKERIEDYYKSV